VHGAEALVYSLYNATEQLKSFVADLAGQHSSVPRQSLTNVCRVPGACDLSADAGEMDKPGSLLGVLSDIFVPAARALEAEPPTFYPDADRIIAIGDVHGDLSALRNALRLAKLIGTNDEWVGGNTVLVQMGDILDRGDQERAAFELLMKLREEAPKQGGLVHVLHGNHEIMNASFDFRYVTPGGFKDFDTANGDTKDKVGKISNVAMETIKGMPDFMRARAMSLRPGGSFAGMIARNQVAIVVGDNVFVHGGLRPTHLAEPGALEAMNAGCRAWLQGRSEKPNVLKTGKSPIWMRHYSNGRPAVGSDECNVLQATLDLIPAKRMIVGHTPQQDGINAACGAKVWRVDTGMSAVYGGPCEALEITRQKVRVLTNKGWRSAHSRTVS